jgi:hypothetical protein
MRKDYTLPELQEQLNGLKEESYSEFPTPTASGYSG